VSFAARYRELKASRLRSHPVWDVNAKLAGRDYAAARGVRVPRLLCVHENVRMIPPHAGPAVLKPNDGCSARAVLPLIPAGVAWRDYFSGEVRPWPEWMARAGTYRQRRAPTDASGIGGPWLLEEMVGDGIRLPDEWKALVVGGVVQLVAQFRREPGEGRSSSGKRTTYWTRDMERIPGGIKLDRAVCDLPPAIHGAALVETAEMLCRDIDAPMMRVDLYEDEEGVIFGEFTPEPGGTLEFRPEWDAKMGAAWP